MSTRLLYVHHDRSPLYQPVVRSLIDYGFNVNFFNYYKSSNYVKGLGLMSRLPISSRVITQELINQHINTDLLNRTKIFKPRYLLVSKALHISFKILKAINDLGVITINWFPDFWEFLPWMKKNAPYYDYFFNPDLLVIQELNNVGIHAYYLPFATYPDEKLIPVKNKYDIVFIGQYTKRREKFLKPLVSLGLKIWGYQDWLRSSLVQCYQGHLPTLDDVFQKYRESKIVINVVTGEDRIPIKTVNLRVFEVCGVGRFLLNWYKEPIDDFFVENKEIVNFRSQEELLKKAKYYLYHEKEREKIARAGWQRTVKDHTWKKRFKKMFQIINAN